LGGKCGKGEGKMRRVPWRGKRIGLKKGGKKKKERTSCRKKLFAWGRKVKRGGKGESRGFGKNASCLKGRKKGGEKEKKGTPIIHGRGKNERPLARKTSKKRRRREGKEGESRGPEEPFSKVLRERKKKKNQRSEEEERTKLRVLRGDVEKKKRKESSPSV